MPHRRDMRDKRDKLAPKVLQAFISNALGLSPCCSFVAIYQHLSRDKLRTLARRRQLLYVSLTAPAGLQSMGVALIINEKKPRRLGNWETLGAAARRQLTLFLRLSPF